MARGKSQYQAAVDAGYAPSTARNPSRAIKGANVRAQFANIVREFVDPEKVGQRIAEGLDATETRFFQHEGMITDSANVISWSERRNYARLAAEFCGYHVDKKELDVNVGEMSEYTDEELKYIIEHKGELPPEKQPVN